MTASMDRSARIANARPALQLPRFELPPVPSFTTASPLHAVTSARPVPDLAALPAPAPVAPVPVVVPAPAPVPAPVQQLVTPAAPPRPAAAPVVATSKASLTRRDGALGFALGMLALVVVLAAALAMQRSMHGWPPGMH